MACKIVSVTQLPPEKKTQLVRYLPDEMRALQALEHDHIIGFYGLYMFDNCYNETRREKCPLRVVYFMSRADGGDLLAVAQRTDHGLDHHLAQIYFKQIASALEYMVTQNWAHLDIKPENILVSGNGERVYLTDFSFAIKWCPTLGEGNPSNSTPYIRVTCGSPHYLAPEIRRGIVCDPFKCDIWAFGVTLFVVLTKKFPFNSNRKGTIIQQQLKLTFEPLTETRLRSHLLLDLIRKLFEPKFKNRISAKDISLHPWFSSQSDQEPKLP
jgi:serine/threonine protein kinase